MSQELFFAVTAWFFISFCLGVYEHLPDLRHTCAVLSLQNGMSAKEVARMLGHFRTAMTRQNYAPYLASPAAKDENTSAEASPEELRQAADILNNLLNF